jgi:hypothetical protein
LRPFWLEQLMRLREGAAEVVVVAAGAPTSAAVAAAISAEEPISAGVATLAVDISAAAALAECILAAPALVISAVAALASAVGRGYRALRRGLVSVANAHSLSVAIRAGWPAAQHLTPIEPQRSAGTAMPA